MVPREVDTFDKLRAMEIGSCAGCGLLWFDNAASISLTPKAVLGLFQYIAEVAPTARNTLASSFRCPRCFDALSLTHDLQHATRFTYWRCANDRGQLFTFTQFLREKDFIRAPSPQELAKLREIVRQITCSQCGGSIDLAADSACPHCGSPIALIDPDGVAKAVRALSAASPATAIDRGLSATLHDAQANAILDAERFRESESDHDLIAIGATAIGAVLAGLILSR